ncbi:MAG TPA: ABC transporter permease [Gemmatimonadales bacterium]|nr:ABC transporter permease [Gemmatimonadales bacterium]
MLRVRQIASVLVGLDSLAANPLRTALSTLGIVMGSASLVAVLSLGDGLERFARSQIERTTDLHALSLTPEFYRRVDGQRLARSDTIHLDPAAAGELIAGLGGIAGATLTLTGAGELAGGPPGFPRAAVLRAVWYQGRGGPEQIAAGRDFTPAELTGAAPLALISDTLARALAGSASPERAVGMPLQLSGGQTVTVIGVLPPRQMGDQPSIAVPYGAAGAVMSSSLGPRIPSLVIAATDLEGVAPLRSGLEAELARRYGAWKERIHLASNSSRLEQARQGMLVFKLVMGAITGVSLLVGGVGIMNVLLAAVAERTREIGIRKAVGARRRDILTQFLAESVAIAGAGSVIGLVLGVSGAFGITAIIRARTEATIYAGLAWTSVAVAGLAAVSVGLAFGCYPALRAARLSPIDAIRHE